MRLVFCKGTKLRMTSLPLATAATLYHRFFHHFSEDDFDPHVCIVIHQLHYELLDIYVWSKYVM